MIKNACLKTHDLYVSLNDYLQKRSDYFMIQRYKNEQKYLTLQNV